MPLDTFQHAVACHFHSPLRPLVTLTSGSLFAKKNLPGLLYTITAAFPFPSRSPCRILLYV